MSGPLQSDDPRHEQAAEAARRRTGAGKESVRLVLDTYFASLEEQGCVLVEAYAGDDSGRA